MVEFFSSSSPVSVRISIFNFQFTIAWILWYLLFFRNIAIIGGDSGQLIFYSLNQSRHLASLNTGTKTPIFSLSICSDFFRNFSYLIVSMDILIISNYYLNCINFDLLSVDYEWFEATVEVTPWERSQWRAYYFNLIRTKWSQVRTIWITFFESFNFQSF